MFLLSLARDKLSTVSYLLSRHCVIPNRLYQLNKDDDRIYCQQRGTVYTLWSKVLQNQNPQCCYISYLWNGYLNLLNFYVS